jgi:iron complex outermembrane recepter protein
VVYGGELELASRPTDNLDINAGLGFLDTKVDDIFNPVGAVPALRDAELPLAPDITANLQIRYTWPLGENKFWVQGSGRYRDEIWRDSLNNESTLIESNTQVDALVGFGPEDDRWSVTVWCTNLFDSQREINAFDLAGLLGTGELVYQTPRWFGASFTTKF